MKRQINVFKYFGFVYLTFAISFLILIFFYRKGELHLMLTSTHNSFMDIFFRGLTEIGGSIPIIVGLLFLFYRIGVSLYVLSAQLLNVSLTTMLKLYFGVARPKTYFAEHFPHIVLHKIEGITLHSSNGFPSGHTSAAFALMFCIALIARKRIVSVFCCFFAILTGYSRIYLSQHFADDVLLGSFIGILSALIMYLLYKKMDMRFGWFQKSILSFFSKKNLSC